MSVIERVEVIFGPGSVTLDQDALLDTVNVDGSELVNMGISWTPSSMQNLNVEFVMKNTFDIDTLYPLNGTGNLAGADGAPAIEGQTWWMNFGYIF